MTPPTEPEGWEAAYDRWVEAGRATGDTSNYRSRQRTGFAAGYRYAEAAPPAPPKPLSDEDVERAARAYHAFFYGTVQSTPAAFAEKHSPQRIEAMRAALSTLPVAGGGEVAGLIEEGKAFVAKQPLRIGNELITRLVDALEGRL